VTILDVVSEPTTSTATARRHASSKLAIVVRVTRA